MAEGRMLKKAISTSRRLADLKTDSARMLYTWIIPHLDIEGRFYADPFLIKGSIVPRVKTFTEAKITECLEDMAMVGLIRLYVVDGDRYLQLRKFSDHQSLRLKKEAKSIIPAPPIPDNSGPTPVLLPDNSRTTPAQDKRREDKRREDICASNHPTIEQVKAYCLERKNHVDPQQWLDHYTSNGWMVGRNKMKDWKAAVRTWERTGFERGNGKRQATQPQQRDPFVMCTKCGEEYLETDIIDVNGSFYCPKCPEARAAYSGGGDRVRGLVSGIGRSIGNG